VNFRPACVHSARSSIVKLEKQSIACRIQTQKAGEAYHGLGETDRVFALFEEAYRNRDGTLPFVLLYPIFDPIRSDPRFVSLLQRVFVPFPED
jgi:hypothetical protein